MADPPHEPPSGHRVYNWDPLKNRANRLKHGLDFVDAIRIFDGPVVFLPDDREDYGEERWVAMGC